MASTGLLIAGLAGLGGSVASGAIGASAAGHAAQTQAQAAEQAAQLQYQAQQNALNFEQEQLGLSTANQQPFIGTGTAAENALAAGMGLTPTPPNAIAQSVINNAQNIAGAGGPTQIGTPGVTYGQPQTYTLNNGNSTATVPTGAQIVNDSMRVPSGAQTNSLGATQQTSVSGNVLMNPPQNAFQLPSSPANSLAQPTAGGIGAAGTVGGPEGSLSSSPLNTQGNLNATSLNEQWATPFQAPTEAEAWATPGESFVRDQGNQAIQNSAAAHGNLLSSSTLKGLSQWNQDLAKTYYQQAYNNALNQYQQNYNIFNQNQGTAFNRLAALAGGGQTAIGQLSSAGQNAANANANILQNGAQAIGQAQQNAAAATASGYVGGANALGGALSGVGNSLSSLSLLSLLQNPQNAGII